MADALQPSQRQLPWGLQLKPRALLIAQLIPGVSTGGLDSRRVKPTLSVVAWPKVIVALQRSPPEESYRLQSGTTRGIPQAALGLPPAATACAPMFCSVRPNSRRKNVATAPPASLVRRVRARTALTRGLGMVSSAGVNVREAKSQLPRTMSPVG